MEILLERSERTSTSTIGVCMVNGIFECYILEDVDRGLRSDIPLDEIKAKKVYGKTAIPTGRYEVVITYSNRFKKPLPLLLNVPGYAGIRIHPGNNAGHTEGCLLPGMEYKPDMVLHSRAAFAKLFEKIKLATKKEKVFIEIK